MEREVMLTGIGGQSVQLAAQVLARAAAYEDRHVTYLALYGGTMRGGNTDATLVIGDEPISSPPLVSRPWSAIAMHHKFWPALAAKLRPGGVVVLNSGLFEERPDRERQRVFEVPATQRALELGNSLAASMVLLGAYAGITGMVGVESLVQGMRESVPSYRQQHLTLNEKALRAGFEGAESNAAPAWSEDPQ
jgi:2-oxoacid:acceptor oxidoreductase gamma subunit (pyruvate/2-ketoisovalerate family)